MTKWRRVRGREEAPEESVAHSSPDERSVHHELAVYSVENRFEIISFSRVLADDEKHIFKRSRRKKRKKKTKKKEQKEKTNTGRARGMNKNKWGRRENK